LPILGRLNIAPHWRTIQSVIVDGTKQLIFPDMQTQSIIRKVEEPSENSLRYPGWRIVLSCHICVLVGFAAVFIYSFTLMVKPMQHEFGWNREQISRCFTVAALSVAICSPFVGKLLDRFEPRKLITACMIGLGVGLASMAWLTPRLWQLYVTAAFIGVAGSGTYQLGYARVIATWFQRRLGGALSVVVAGSSIGSIVLPSLVQGSISRYGWRATYLFLALLPLLLGAPLTWCFVRTSHRGSPAPRQPETGKNFREALVSRGFWLLAIGVCCVSLSENGALAHLAPMLSDRGLRLADAALVTSVLGGSGLAGRLLLGWLLDYLEGSHIAAISLLLAGAGIYLLAHSSSFHSAALGALLAGLGMGCELDLIPYILRRYYGLRSFSTLYGSIYCVFCIAGGVAPLLMGHVFDATGSYTGLLSIFSVLTMVAAFAMLALPKYRASQDNTGQPECLLKQELNFLNIPEEGVILESH
jgi:predicted MFS family arabinose efflux permease